MKRVTAFAVTAVAAAAIYWWWCQRKKHSDDSVGFAPERVVIIFGSQTGTAEAHARQLAADLSSGNFTVDLFDMADVVPGDSNLACFDEDYTGPAVLLLVLISTAGEGEIPDSARKFVKCLKRQKRNSSRKMQHAVCALGNSDYQYFNVAGIRVNRYIESAGSIPFERLRLCDEAMDIDAAVQEWCADCGARLLGSVVSDSFSTVPDGVRLCLTKNRSQQNKTNADGMRNWSGNTTRFCDEAKCLLIKESKLLVGDENNPRVMELTLSHADGDVTWGPGDVLEIMPQSEESIVLAIANRLLKDSGWELKDLEIIFYRPKGDMKLSLLNFLETMVDVVQPNHSSILNLMRTVGSTNDRKLFMKTIKDLWYNQVASKMLTLAEVLDKFFPTTTFANDLQSLLAVIMALPPKKPRAYSISSSPTQGKMSITVALNIFRTPDGKIRHGQCSQWLLLKPPEQIYAKLNKGTLLPPSKNENGTLIFIAGGTGVAPIRAMLWDLVPEDYSEREKTDNWREKAGLPKKVIFLFGCRNREQDFLYREEFEYLSGITSTPKKGNLLLENGKAGVITDLWLAPSREEKRKIYVQDVLFEQRSVLRQVQKDARIWICGSTVMGRAVKTALKGVLGAQQFSNIVQQRRLHEEIWGG